MTKDEFLKKHNLTEADYRNLQRFEEKMVDFIRKDDNYGEFLETWEEAKCKKGGEKYER